MKRLTGIGIIDIILTIIFVGILSLFPNAVDKMFPKVKSSKRIEGDFDSWLQNNNYKLYYAIKKVKSDKTSLTQFVSFYLPVLCGGRKQLMDITDYLPTKLLDRLHSTQFYKGKRNKLNGTWEFKDFDIVEFSKELVHLYKQAKLVCVDKGI